MTRPAARRPAILDGQPVRPQGPPSWPILSSDVQNQILSLAQSGEWGRYHGPYCPRLQQRLAEYHGVERVHLCSSGTAAMELALRGIGIEPGDEVVLAAYDFKANFQNVICVGAVPVLVDISADNWQLNPDHLTSALTPRTRAVIVSHLHGGIVDMPRVCEFAGTHGIAVIEDACQNPGAVIHGRRSGATGDIGIHSFGGSKLLTAGRGGAVITNRADIAERIRRYVMRGNDAYPLSEFQAAVVLPQLDQLDELNQRRANAVDHLSACSEKQAGLTVLQVSTPSIQPAYYKVGLRYQAAMFGGLSRDLFAAAIRAEGFAIDPGFRALNLIHAARRFREVNRLVEAEKADTDLLMLHHPVLLDAQGLDDFPFALEKIREFADEIRENAAVTIAPEA